MRSAPTPLAPRASASSWAPVPEPVEVLALDPHTQLATGTCDGRPCYRLQAGAIRVSVRHQQPDHEPLQVHAQDLLIEDVGTVFEVRLQNDRQVEVRVIEGLVRVTRGASHWMIAAGHQETFQEASPAAPPASASSWPERSNQTPPGPSGAPAPSLQLSADAPRLQASAPGLPASPLPEPPRPSRRWVALAEAGDYTGAYALLVGAEKEAVTGVADLLLAGDVARLTRHPSEAVVYLRRARARSPGHPQAAMAAFTLGRVLLEELSQPAPAAAEFEVAHALGGPLAEDALARAVEAHSKAGNPGRARQLAEQYTRSHPSGRRLRAVRLFGGLTNDP